MSDAVKIDPSIGFCRLKTILGDPKSIPPKPPIIPISKSSWWAGIQSGRFPQGVKIGPRTTAWRRADIDRLCSELASRGE